MKKRITGLLGLLVLFGALLLSACSNSTLGYGVVLWNDAAEIELTNGQIIAITGESKVNQTYQFEYQAQSYDIPISRVAFFRHMTRAKEYREKFLQYHNWYAVNKNSSGLIMRASPSVRAEQVYRLRLEEIVKVLGQASEQVTLGKGIQGKWYEVLTMDGVRGYAFDYYLHIQDYENEVMKLAANEQEDTGNKIGLDNLQGYWYLRNYVAELQHGEKMDIRLLELPHGQLFLEDTQLKLYLKKPYSKPFSISYSDVNTDIPFELKFLDSGTRITFETTDTLSIYYQDAEAKEVISNLQRIRDEELELYRREAQIQRRADLSYILERGSQFSAPKLYGSIRFGVDGQFEWSNTDVLVEKNMLEEAQTEGSIYFLYQLDSVLQERYDQIITFAFANGEELSFLLKINDYAVRMRYLPPYMTAESNLISSDAIAGKIDLEMFLEGRPLELG